jgi:hypothetical protein
MVKSSDPATDFLGWGAERSRRPRKLGLERIVSKKLDAPYRSGPSIMTYAKTLLYLFASGAIIVLSAGSASAQSKGPGEGVYRNTRPPDPEQGGEAKIG